MTDSAAALPAEMLTQHGISVASMEVTIDGQTFIDGPGDELADFYQRLRSAERLPTTSAPRPATWLDALEKAAEIGNSILCVTLSSNLSAAFDAARVAAEMAVERMPGIEIHVLDSKAAAGSQALLALQAARLAADGESLDAVENQVRDLTERVRLLAILDTLEYIHRGGRVPKIAVWASSFFNIKPVMEFSDGRVGSLARPRTRRRAMERMLREVFKDVGGRRAHVNVMHADAEDEAKEGLERIRAEVDAAEIFLTQFHPFMGAHTGPGLVGVSYWVEEAP